MEAEAFVEAEADVVAGTAPLVDRTDAADEAGAVGWAQRHEVDREQALVRAFRRTTGAGVERGVAID